MDTSKTLNQNMPKMRSFLKKIAKLWEFCPRTTIRLRRWGFCPQSSQLQEATPIVLLQIF